MLVVFQANLYEGVGGIYQYLEFMYCTFKMNEQWESKIPLTPLEYQTWFGLPLSESVIYWLVICLKSIDIHEGDGKI
jgi:hypothetical protein